MPQLDSLRAVAVFLVMIHHFNRDWALGLPFGTIGVQLFFVLSGFLITDILLRARRRVETRQIEPAMAIKHFYIRRFFRIFPLFYLVLAVAWLAGAPDVRASLPWHLAYASNIYFARLGYFTDFVGHFWSLAVEEQFYLLWPFIILFTPRRWLFAVLVAAAAVGPLYRGVGGLLGIYSTVHWIWLFAAPFANVDSLAAGGILAYLSVNDRWVALRDRVVDAGLIVAVPLALVLCLCVVNRIAFPGFDLARLTFENTMWALLFTWVIGRAARGFSGITGRLLELRPLLYLGKISYGLYVIHLFMLLGLPSLFAQLNITYPSTRTGRFPLLVLATIALAACSWHLYEKPLNRLKDRYSQVPPVAASTRAIA
jgi:peptidoglycan/LPS O-acetylase OafA/YrhL